MRTLPDETEFTTGELQAFLRELFCSYIAQDDYDAWVGQKRKQHFKMLSAILATLEAEFSKHTPN